MKKMLGYTRVSRINNVRDDYKTVGLNLTKENAISLAESILKTVEEKEINKVVLTAFKNRTNNEGMRMIVSAY